MSQPELLPCPFCGKQPSVAWVVDWGHVHCSHCGADGPAVHDTDDDSPITAWNRRASTEKGTRIEGWAHWNRLDDVLVNDVPSLTTGDANVSPCTLILHDQQPLEEPK